MESKGGVAHQGAGSVIRHGGQAAQGRGEEAGAGGHLPALREDCGGDSGSHGGGQQGAAQGLRGRKINVVDLYVRVYKPGFAFSGKMLWRL